MALVAAKLTDEDLARFRSMDAKKEGYRVKPDGYSAQEIEQNEIALSRFWGEVAKRYEIDDAKRWTISASTGVIIYGDWD